MFENIVRILSATLWYSWRDVIDDSITAYISIFIVGLLITTCSPLTVDLWYDWRVTTQLIMRVIDPPTTGFAFFELHVTIHIVFTLWYVRIVCLVATATHIVVCFCLNSIPTADLFMAVIRTISTATPVTGTSTKCNVSTTYLMRKQLFILNLKWLDYISLSWFYYELTCYTLWSQGSIVML